MKKELEIIKEKKKVICIRKKELYKMYDIFIKKMDLKGTHFINFTHNLPHFKTGLKFMPEEKLIDKILEYTHSGFLQKTEQIDFSLVTIERHKNGMPHIHGVIGIRPICHETATIICNLESRFFEDGGEDCLFNVLPTQKDVKAALRYVSKDWEIYDEKITYKAIFTSYSQQNLKEHYFFSSNVIANVGNAIGLENKKGNQLPFSKFFYTNVTGGFFPDEYYQKPVIQGKNYMVPGMRFTKKTSKRFKILHYINVYLSLYDMFFYKGNLYMKNHNSRYTYVYLGDYTYLMQNMGKITRILISTFIETLPLVDTFGDLFDNLKQVESIIKNNVDDFLVNKKIYNNVIEFNDGIYIMEYDKFFPTKEVNPLLKNDNQIRCTRYYNQNYLTTLKQTSKLIPKTWLKYLGENVEDTTEFCAKFGKYFFEENDVNAVRDRKKNSMFIKGKSSTGKTMLLTNALIDRWGMENITMMTDNSNFTFENIQKNKNLIIQDEFEYQKKNRGNMLKMLDNQPMAVNVKNKRSNIQTHNAPIIFLGNPTNNNANMLEDAAFEKRLDVYEFSEELEVTPEEVAQIKKEEVKIIIYCNKLYQRQKRNVNRVNITKQEKLDIIKQIGEK